MAFLDKAGVTKLVQTLYSLIDPLIKKKQDTLVSGENIKTINNQSVLGSGNISIEGAGSWYGTSSSTSGSDKEVTATGYQLTAGARVSITFTNANTYSGTLRMNINYTGWKVIYLNNASTSSSNPLTWDAGETLTFVWSGSHYYFVGKSKTSVNIPVASASTIGGVKVGNGLSITSSGLLSAEWKEINYEDIFDASSARPQLGGVFLTNGKLVYAHVMMVKISGCGWTGNGAYHPIVSELYAPATAYNRQMLTILIFPGAGSLQAFLPDGEVYTNTSELVDFTILYPIA